MGITDGSDDRVWTTCVATAVQPCNSTEPDYCKDPERNFPKNASKNCDVYSFGPHMQCGRCYFGFDGPYGFAVFCAKNGTEGLYVTYGGVWSKNITEGSHCTN